jgi:hypothetical protein
MKVSPFCSSILPQLAFPVFFWFQFWPLNISQFFLPFLWGIALRSARVRCRIAGANSKIHSRESSTCASWARRYLLHCRVPTRTALPFSTFCASPKFVLLVRHPALVDCHTRRAFWHFLGRSLLLRKPCPIHETKGSEIFVLIPPLCPHLSAFVPAQTICRC